MTTSGRLLRKPFKLFADSTPPRIHFIGVCGVATAPVAAELKRCGFEITGSDSGLYPPMSDFLVQQGISAMEGFAPENLPEVGLIVVGNAVSRGNPELEEALDLGLPLISLPELISRRYLGAYADSDDSFVSFRRPVVIAGSHGKTTTTAMTAHILRACGRDPGWLVGGVPLDLPVPCHFGEGGEFVIEGDEYDVAYFDKRPKFLLYRPHFAVLNAVEFDHADIYDDIEHVTAAFTSFVRLIPRAGALFVTGDNERASEIAKSAFCRVVRFGRTPGCEWRMKGESVIEDGYWSVSIESSDGKTHTLRMGVCGEFNLMNGLAALAVCETMRVGVSEALEALRVFKGVGRRLELIRESPELTVYDDFAHHPTAIRETLIAVRQKHPDKRIWALFEPRSNTMVRNFYTEELTTALSLADVAIIEELHRKERIPVNERLDRHAIVLRLRQSGVESYASEGVEDLLNFVKERLNGRDVLVLMSNGSFGGLREALIKL